MSLREGEMSIMEGGRCHSRRERDVTQEGTERETVTKGGRVIQEHEERVTQREEQALGERASP